MPTNCWRCCEASGFPAERLTLEVTEQALLADIQMAARTLARLSEAGIRIALDDFGAGFCNFRYLKLLPLDYLKLDRSMVDGIASDSRDLAVFRAIVAMARALDLEVIAEGIESEAQRDLIAEEGCALLSGLPAGQADVGRRSLRELAGGIRRRGSSPGRRLPAQSRSAPWSAGTAR